MAVVTKQEEIAHTYLLVCEILAKVSLMQEDALEELKLRLFKAMEEAGPYNQADRLALAQMLVLCKIYQEDGK